MRLKVFHEGEWKSYPAKSYQEYTYEWLGEPHASESVRLDDDGNETARNLFGYQYSHHSNAGYDASRWTSAVVAIEPNTTYTVTIRDKQTSRFGLWQDPLENGTLAPMTHPSGPVSLIDDEFYSTEPGDDIVHTVTTLDFGGYLVMYLSNEGPSEHQDLIMVEQTDEPTLYFDGDTESDRAWVDFQPRNISGIKRIWPRSESPPPPGTHYAWLGEPHGSVSVRLDGDGNETARNHALYPSQETGGVSHLRTGSLVNFGGITTSNPDRISHGRGARVVSWEPDVVEIRMIIQQTVTVEPGDWVAISTHTTSAHGDLYAAGIITEADENNIYIRHNYLGEYVSVGRDNMTKLTYVVQMGEGVGTVRAGLRFSGSPGDYSPIPASAYGYLDGWHIARADSESAALAQVEHYFDGDTASDRANDLWYNADGVPHEWVNGQGWVAI